MGRNNEKYSPEEKKLCRKHPELGQKTVQFINKLDNIGILIRCHHEEYDGKCYPDQLSEEEIPLGSKIIAVANAYDNIVNLKIFKDPSIEKDFLEIREKQVNLSETAALQKAAIHYLKSYSFSMFDPGIIKILLRLLKTKENFLRDKIEIYIGTLEEGMVPVRPFYSINGHFLFSYNTVLKKGQVGKIKNLRKKQLIPETMHILKQNVQPADKER